MTDKHGLTPKQKAWCDFFLESGNAIEAARKAGYKYPKASAEDNKQKPACIAYIAERTKPTEERRIASADEVLQFLTDVMLGKVKDQFGLDASLQDRTNAAKELMKRYAVADQRQQGTMAKLDAILLEFTTALQQPAAAPAESAEEHTPDALGPA